MPIQFSPEVDQLVRQEMVAGGYGSEDELLRDALRALAERREVLTDIQVGIKELEAGRGRPLEEVDADLRTKYSIPREI